MDHWLGPNLKVIIMFPLGFAAAALIIFMFAWLTYTIHNWSSK